MTTPPSDIPERTPDPQGFETWDLPKPQGVRPVEAQSFDVEAMLRECVPGGSICDPQQVADELRAYFASGVPGVDRG